MDFFNDLGKKFTHAARSIQERTRESVENTRLAADLREAREELALALTELGRAYYASVAEDAGRPSAELVDRVRAAMEAVEALTAQRDRPQKRCPGCGAAQSPDARFCSNCGRRMPEDAPTPPEVSADGEYCPECGAMRHDSARFCAVCGHAFDGQDRLPAVQHVPAAPEKPPEDAPEEPDRFED